MPPTKEMNFRLICSWSDGALTTSLHSLEDYANRKLSSLMRRWKLNRLPERPQHWQTECLNKNNNSWEVLNAN
jgi:hypothetical protein